MPPTTPSQLKTRRIAEIGIGVALSTVLSMVVVYAMPQGGSVTLASTVPLWILSLRFGVRSGITAGFLHGVVQALLGKGLIHPLQVLLDYPLAYAFQGLVGWRGPGGRWLGILFAVSGRLACHCLASTFFLSAQMSWQARTQASLAYNFPFVILDGVVAVVVLEMLLETRTGLGESLESQI